MKRQQKSFAEKA